MSYAAESLDTDALPEISTLLSRALAETAVVTRMPQNFHWKVTGMRFASLHKLFPEVYDDYFQGQDDLAERIKLLNGHADGNLARMPNRSRILEPETGVTPKDMIVTCLEAGKTLASTVERAAEMAAEHGDTCTENLCIARGQVHEKLDWMLRAHLR